MIREGVSNCFAISLWFRFEIQLETRLASMVTALIAAGGNSTINCNVVQVCDVVKCSHVSKLLGTESETCLQLCL